MLGFDAGIGYQEVLYEQGVHNTVEDFPFIAAFHYNGLKPFNVSSYRGQVYYKLIRDRRTLNDFKGYVWNATVGHSEYVHPLMALQVTWENVQEEGCVTDTCPVSDLLMSGRFYPFIYPSIHPSIHPSIYLFIYLFIYVKILFILIGSVNFAFVSLFEKKSNLVYLLQVLSFRFTTSFPKATHINIIFK